ncbi:MAG: LysM peptidoglycan-binding domain-containing protein [Akkermansiaceae bacterium]|nr:LysM peptidoglycan-binding domain-containing protein [Akkermansiaceae bacterium]
MLGYHIVVSPLGGVYEKIIPKTAVTTKSQKLDTELTQMLKSSELPQIDPGEKSFEKANELLALGQMEEAHEKLTSIVEVFPTSPSATKARRIVGEMNLDQVLSTAHMEGKQSHIVKRGNSFLSIAAEYQTTLDMIMYLNGMLELKGLQPGDELIVMALDFRILIEPQRKALSIWKGDQFIREYPIVEISSTGKLTAGKTKISSKTANIEGRPVTFQSKEYRKADKIILIAKPSLQIRSATENGESTRGIILSPQDMEEMNLLIRVGNDVEIR